MFTVLFTVGRNTLTLIIPLLSAHINAYNTFAFCVCVCVCTYVCTCTHTKHEIIYDYSLATCHRTCVILVPNIHANPTCAKKKNKIACMHAHLCKSREKVVGQKHHDTSGTSSVSYAMLPSAAALRQRARVVEPGGDGGNLGAAEALRVHARRHQSVIHVIEAQLAVLSGMRTSAPPNTPPPQPRLY